MSAKSKPVIVCSLDETNQLKVFCVTDIEVSAGVVVFALSGIIIQDPTGEVERAFQALAGSILVTHHVYSVHYAISHVNSFVAKS